MIQTQETKVVQVIKPQAIVDNAEWVGSKGSTPLEIDTAGFDELDVYVCLGATDIKMAVMNLHECDTSGGTYTAVTGANFGDPDILPSATDDGKVYAWHVSLLGKKRYFEVELKAGDGAAGTYASAFAVLSRAKQGPTTAAGRGLASELFV
jgi:hypothetical protein